MFKYDPKLQGHSIEIGVPIDETSPLPTKATVFEKDDEGFPLQVDEYTLASDVSDGEIARAKSTNSSTEESDTISKSIDIIPVDDGTAVIRHHSDLSESRETMKSGDGDISVQVDPIPPESSCPMDNIACWACKDSIAVVNTFSCGGRRLADL